MVNLEGVSKGYFGQTKVLDRVSLSLERGDFLYLVGGTGAGKSTLLRLLATEEEPTGGQVSLFGYDLSRISPSTMRSIRQSIGYIPQDCRLIPELSVYDNIALSFRLAGSRSGNRQVEAGLRDRIHEFLGVLRLSSKRDVSCAKLSGGEKQKVAIARAMIRSPKLIIADEPTGGQDQESTFGLMDLFVRANSRGATIVIATHDREIVKRVRRKCALIKNGKVVTEEQLCFL